MNCSTLSCPTSTLWFTVGKDCSLRHEACSTSVILCLGVKAYLGTSTDLGGSFPRLDRPAIVFPILTGHWCSCYKASAHCPHASIGLFTPVIFAATELHNLKPETEVRSHLGKESQQLGIPACTRQCAAGASGRAKPAPALVKASR